MSKLTTHILVSGKVQGVGFRQFVHSNAKALGLNGWVRNLKDGRVEAILTADEGRTKLMIAHMLEGPRYSEVSSLEKVALKEDFNFKDFAILETGEKPHV